MDIGLSECWYLPEIDWNSLTSLIAVRLPQVLRLIRAAGRVSAGESGRIGLDGRRQDDAGRRLDRPGFARVRSRHPGEARAGGEYLAGEVEVSAFYGDVVGAGVVDSGGRGGVYEASTIGLIMLKNGIAAFAVVPFKIRDDESVPYQDGGAHLGLND